jgi:hypothetical protein
MQSFKSSGLTSNLKDFLNLYDRMCPLQREIQTGEAVIIFRASFSFNKQTCLLNHNGNNNSKRLMSSCEFVEWVCENGMKAPQRIL